MKWKAHKLMNTDSFFDFWDKSDPFLRFMKIREDNSHLEACRTEVIKDNLSPSWKPIEMNAGRLHTMNNSRFKYFFENIEDCNVGIGSKVEKINLLVNAMLIQTC